MKSCLLLLATFLCTTLGFTQKIINDPNAELRVISSYHAIQVSSGIDVYLSQGKETIAISARDAVTRTRILTEVKEGVLIIRYEWKDGKKFSVRGNGPMKVYVSYKTLDRITASGGSDIYAEDIVQSPSLFISISGGADFLGKVDVDMLTVQQSGGADVKIQGKAKTLHINASGGSDFKGYDLLTNDCSVSASGGSDIDVTVTNELTAEASGASDINWKGPAQVKKAKANGAGSVRHRI